MSTKTNQAPPAPFKFTQEFFNVALSLDDLGRIDLESRTLLANIVNKELRLETAKWVKVFGVPEESRPTELGDWGWTSKKDANDTHFSYLTPPQLIEVEECEVHELDVVYDSRGEECFRNGEPRCKHCFVKLFKTITWTPNPVKKDGAND